MGGGPCFPCGRSPVVHDGGPVPPKKDIMPVIRTAAIVALGILLGLQSGFVVGAVAIVVGLALSYLLCSPARKDGQLKGGIPFMRNCLPAMASSAPSGNNWNFGGRNNRGPAPAPAGGNFGFGRRQGRDVADDAPPAYVPPSNNGNNFQFGGAAAGGGAPSNNGQNFQFGNRASNR